MEDFQFGYDCAAAGRLPLEKLITHRITLDELPRGLDLCHNHLDECIKVIVYPRLSQA